MNKTINIIYSEKQPNVFLEVESVLVNLINHQGKDSVQLNYISSEDTKTIKSSIPTGIILSNESIIKDTIQKNHSISNDICQLTIGIPQKENDQRVLVFNMDETKKNYLNQCFNFLSLRQEKQLTILVENATHLRKVENDLSISLLAKQFSDLQLNFVFAEDLAKINAFRFETVLSFLDTNNLNQTLKEKGYKTCAKPVYINNNFMGYSIAQSEKGLGSLDAYFDDLSTLIFLLESIGLKESSICLKTAIAQVKEEYKHQLENPIDIYRFGEMITYAIEDGESYHIANKNQSSNYGTII